ncbi:host-nuclease inhibitor Gam family protein [Lysinibacillus xylanilyticus]|uniref:host-nuclease inhibitor Gam family protein n=1 Tax=Lysinibacillus xylanilyticus TaxID=582475 RepID=UPI00083C92F3|nr:host-nuclease inhibitor Gam family protein [Lysinibacillus xylanilyticus]
MNLLQETELHELYEMQPQEKQIIVIKDINGLNWALRKINAANTKLNEIKSLADAERERINAWEKKVSAGLASDITFFEQKIFEYHSQVLANDSEQKSIVTPYGRVRSITNEAQPERLDDEELFNYVVANQLPYVEVSTSRKLQWGELKKTLKVVQHGEEQIVVDADGQAVPGVIVKPRTTTFKVEVDD